VDPLEPVDDQEVLTAAAEQALMSLGVEVEAGQRVAAQDRIDEQLLLVLVPRQATLVLGVGLDRLALPLVDDLANREGRHVLSDSHI
jgi:hypothetical protein